MVGKFSFKKFYEIDINDSFFDSLKIDYPGTEHSTGFVNWFTKKSVEGATALVFNDDAGIGAFVALKEENEPIKLTDRTLPAISRLKISTIRLASRYRGQRLGEGALGLILWQWRRQKSGEVYVTVFDKYDQLIGQLEHFGFSLAGYNLNEERVYIRCRRNIDFSDPYRSFPFINPNFPKAGYLIVDDYYHDTLFPYSDLKNTLQESIGLNVANGISKIYVGAQYTRPHYKIGEPILIYRKHTQETGVKRYKSCITSYCVVTDVIMAKTNSQQKMSFEDLVQRIGNKSVFDEEALRTRFDDNKNLIVIEMLYLGYFGEGNNVNMDWLDNNGHWASENQYPTTIQLTPNQFKAILTEGGVNVSDVIIN
jgi:hypothetical protein